MFLFIYYKQLSLLFKHKGYYMCVLINVYRGLNIYINHYYYLMCFGTREEVESMISDTQDGTFFVRDSSQKGKYALTVKTGDTYGHLRIIFSNHKYGLREPTIFNSVAALVAHYRGVPIQTGITLAHPFSKVKRMYVCVLVLQGYALKKLYAYLQFLQLSECICCCCCLSYHLLFCCCFLFPPQA